MKTEIAITGAGFAGMAAASVLAQKGHSVRVFEKQAVAGGRARQLAADGYLFDMGPSWYWMPEVFENYYNRFGYTTSDFYDLRRLDPSYRVFFGKGDVMDIPADYKQLRLVFENIEPGSALRLDNFLSDAKYKYHKGVGDLVFKPSHSVLEFMDRDTLTGVFKLQLFSSISKHIARYFKNEKLRHLLEFPILFLGAKPENTPALYSLMNYADIKLGTWYPMGGLVKIVEAFERIAREQGVQFHFSVAVTNIETNGKRALGLRTEKAAYTADYFVSGADYHHTDQKLLPSGKRNYSTAYWQSRTMAPSSLLFYMGINKRVKNLLHHNMFFDAPFAPHAQAIYETQKWPENPLFYVSMPSATDPAVAPSGCENMVILIPIAPGLQDDDEIREVYYQRVMDRLETLTNQEIKPHVVYKRSYAVRDFIKDYNSFKGNAYGLANTLRQTAFLKPALRNKQLQNFYYTGQLTTPGPGVPPAILSGQVAAREILKQTIKNH